MEPQHGDRPHSPGPSLYPIAFAAGIACILVGLIVNPKIIVPIGAVIAIVFGFLWARDATEEFRGEPVHAIDPESGGPPESTDAPAIPPTRVKRRCLRPRPVSASRATASSRARRSASAPSSAGS